MADEFDAACGLEDDLEVDERVEIVYAGFQTFGDSVTLKLTGKLEPFTDFQKVR